MKGGAVTFTGLGLTFESAKPDGWLLVKKFSIEQYTEFPPEHALGFAEPGERKSAPVKAM